MSNISLKNNNIELNAILETVNSLSSGKEEQEKSIEITENGTTEITPDDGKTLSKVSITTNVEGIGGDVEEERSKWINRSWTEFSDNEVTTIYGGTFACCSSLSSISFPACTSIGDNAFINCTSLKSIDMSLCTYVGSSAFCTCGSLSFVNLPMCSNIGSYVFYACSSLETVNMPECQKLNYYAFAACPSLTSIDLPACTIVDGYALTNCTSLTSLNLPVCYSIGYGAIRHCTSLTSIDLPDCMNLTGDVFTGCISLSSITLRHSNVVNLTAANAFQSTPMSASSYIGTFGSIYVPASLVDAYKSATNWTVYADRITAITEIQDIDDIIIPLHTTKSYDIQLAGFATVPENISITSNDVNKLNISNIQATTDNITFDATTNDADGELDVTISLFYNGKSYAKLFNVNIVTSPIGNTDITSININRVETISIPWYGSEIASNVLITSSDETKLTVSNIQVNIDNIAFDAATYDIEDEVDITVIVTYNNETYIKTNTFSIERMPTYTVENLETDYTFNLNSDGYYESNNKGINSSYAICKVNIDAPYDCTMYVDCINCAETNYDYGILSNLDTTLTLSSLSGSAASYKKSFKGSSMATVQTVEYDIPAGEHFIYVKFIKDSSQNNNNDSLQFNIRFE